MPKVTVTNAKGLVQETGAAPSAFLPGVGIGVQSLTAAGSNSQANSTAIVAADGGLVLVSGAGSNAGVRLPALSSVPAGTMFMILNLHGSNTLEVFPATDDQIHPTGTDNAGITVAGKGMLICIADAAGVLWASAEPAATGA